MKSLRLHRVTTSIISCICICGITLLTILPWVQEVGAQQIPNEYQANALVQKDRDAILDLFVQFEAVKKLGQLPSVDSFSLLSERFARIFPQLPAKSKYKIIYQQCIALSSSLSQGVTKNNFGQFMSLCFEPLNGIIKEIGNTMTIKAVAKASPSAGPAPLTVTFDARTSSDPSNDTIPSNNYFWYFKNSKGVDTIIGQGAVVNYNFDKEGTYLVHLTVRSANQLTEGILDGEATVTVNVAPQSAILTVYANGKKLSDISYTKIGTQEATRGVQLDGSATIAMGGRKITSHRRSISNGLGGFTYTSEDKAGAPGIITQALPSNGEYRVTLSTVDNENNTMSKTYLLTVSDPIAIMSIAPADPDTSTIVKFDAGKSYALQSRIRLYTREVYDQKGEQVFAVQSKDFSRQFSQPGSYTIKLSVQDELGQTNTESIPLIIQSTPPRPQFSIKPVATRDKPSQFILDAGLSSDIDVTNKVDKLQYTWNFSSDQSVSVDQLLDGGQRAIVSFNQPGIYKAKLTVTDTFGQIANIEKDIKVESTLGPVIFNTPKATVRGQKMTFAVKTNKDIVSYQRNFGDTETRTVQTNVIQHVYQKVGIYTVSLRALGRNGEENTVKTTVFIGEKDNPVGSFLVTNQFQDILVQNENCAGTDEAGVAGTFPAYGVNRYEKIIIDTTDSLNAKGNKDKITSYFQPQDDEIFKNAKFTYDFKDLGCRYIDASVEDSSLGRNSRVRLWFKIFNALPTLTNMSLFFPQYGNEVGIGFNQNRAQNTFDPNTDPLIVKVIAQEAKDPDGFISYYKWYYYNKEDPSRLVETRVTPGSVPYAFFTVPRIAGEWTFGVEMNDNEGAKQTSEKIIGNGPVVFFPPDTKNIDIPIVTLKVDRVNIKAGDEVQFTVIAKTISGRPDFDASKTIKYDFDGDGTFDLTSKDSTVSYVYKKPSTDGIVPKVEVLYRGYKGTAFGDKITIKDSLEPKIEIDQYDKTIIVRDVSIGSVDGKKFCFDLTQCDKPGISETQGTTFVYTYPDYGDYAAEFSITDALGNNAVIKQPIKLTPPTNASDIKLLSLPQGTDTQSTYQISVGNVLQNSIYTYVAYNGIGNCFIDLDISVDIDGDGRADQDRDKACNEAFMRNPLVTEQGVVGRIFFDTAVAGTQKTVTKDIVVSFIDVENLLSQEEKKVYDALTSLIQSIDQAQKVNVPLVDFLIQMRDNLQSAGDVASLVVQIRDYVDTNPVELSTEQKSTLDTLLNQLTDGDTARALGSSTYQQAKQEILRLLPTNLRSDAVNIFGSIEAIPSPKSTPELLTGKLQDLINLLEKNAAPAGQIPSAEQISIDDFDLVIIPNICKILGYYEISSAACPIVVEGAGTATSEDSNSGGAWPTWLRIVAWLFGVVILGFISIVVFFAVKARVQQGGGTTP